MWADSLTLLPLLSSQSASLRKQCSSRDPVYVEFDDLEWEKREWIKVYEEYRVFLLENRLVWAWRKDTSQLQGSKGKQIQWPALYSIFAEGHGQSTRQISANTNGLFSTLIDDGAFTFKRASFMFRAQTSRRGAPEVEQRNGCLGCGRRRQAGQSRVNESTLACMSSAELAGRKWARTLEWQHSLSFTSESLGEVQLSEEHRTCQRASDRYRVAGNPGGFARGEIPHPIHSERTAPHLGWDTKEPKEAQTHQQAVAVSHWMTGRPSLYSARTVSQTYEIFTVGSRLSPAVKDEHSGLPLLGRICNLRK
ncbi:hypothetical protein JZ751_018540 [Albula glossodonta]|uniref:Uncharacterized protein n=1 Tax=Albula glossodonta TaxID=121402 RepID=A0A8T2NWH4_9TELE|nr:hypothetical protein JZ751_018540 [Albula glossodonta]